MITFVLLDDLALIGRFGYKRTIKLVSFIIIFMIHVSVIKGTKILAVIKRMQSRDTHNRHCLFTDIHNKEHKVTKIIHTK